MNKELFSLSAYEYDLPKELIAHHPPASREDSRLMILDRAHGTLSEIPFREIYDWLKSGDSLVFNDTKVIPARLFGKKSTGAQFEILLVRNYGENIWEAMLKPARKAPVGTQIDIASDFFCEVVGENADGTRKLKFHYEGLMEGALVKYGTMPLPHYIERNENLASDQERYQTVFAKNPGAVAAPTAGLHFSKELLQRLEQKGVSQSYITLHVGLGTFRPVQSDDIRQHNMHSELCLITPETAAVLNDRSPDTRQICVGTTTCRTLESLATEKGIIRSGQFDTNIFIYPGYKFKVVNSLLTNFHLPGSTLLMLVSAFAGHEFIQEAYAKAIEKKFRFFSYGDAMLII